MKASSWLIVALTTTVGCGAGGDGDGDGGGGGTAGTGGSFGGTGGVASGGSAGSGGTAATGGQPTVDPSLIVSLPEKIAAGHLLVDGDSLYFSIFREDASGNLSTWPMDLYRASHSGAASVLVADVGRMGNLYQDAQFIYTTRDTYPDTANDDKSLIAIDKATGNISTLYASMNEPKQLAVDDNHIYWIELGSHNGNVWQGSVLRIGKSGGPIASIAAIENGAAVEVDASYVYWAGTKGTLARRAKALSSDPEVLSNSVTYAVTTSYVIAPGAQALFWSEYEDTFNILRFDGSLQTHPRTYTYAGPPVLVDTKVYFTEDEKGNNAPRALGELDLTTGDYRNVGEQLVVGDVVAATTEALYFVSYDPAAIYRLERP